MGWRGKNGRAAPLSVVDENPLLPLLPVTMQGMFRVLGAGQGIGRYW
jgi:hypothetical protein